MDQVVLLSADVSDHLLPKVLRHDPDPDREPDLVQGVDLNHDLLVVLEQVHGLVLAHLLPKTEHLAPDQNLVQDHVPDPNLDQDRGPDQNLDHVPDLGLLLDRERVPNLDQDHQHDHDLGLQATVTKIVLKLYVFRSNINISFVLNK